MTDNIEIVIDPFRRLVSIDGESLQFSQAKLKVIQETSSNGSDIIRIFLPRKFLRNKQRRLSHKLSIRKKINKLCEQKGVENERDNTE